MGLWTDYTKKDTPEDNDTLMLYDTAGKANKQTLFSGFWKWVAKKLKEATLSDLETTNKTMIGAINELNSNRLRFARINYPKDNDALKKLDMPSLIFNQGQALPYIFVFTDSRGDSGLIGGISLVYGFMYEKDNYGVQIAVHYSGTIRKRNKDNNVWTEWTVMH